MWFPGLAGYEGRTTSEYSQLVKDTTLEEIISLVQDRAQEDYAYCIANGLVGENNASAPKLKRMMEFCAKEKNIKQCVEHIYKDKKEHVFTVDLVCRDLANASAEIFAKWSG